VVARPFLHASVQTIATDARRPRKASIPHMRLPNDIAPTSYLLDEENAQLFIS